MISQAYMYKYKYDNISNCILHLFDTASHYVILISPELAMQTRMASNSRATHPPLSKNALPHLAQIPSSSSQFCRGQRKTCRSALSFHHLGPVHQVLRLCDRYLYLPHILPIPNTLHPPFKKSVSWDLRDGSAVKNSSNLSRGCQF